MITVLLKTDILSYPQIGGRSIGIPKIGRIDIKNLQIKKEPKREKFNIGFMKGKHIRWEKDEKLDQNISRMHARYLLRDFYPDKFTKKCLFQDNVKWNNACPVQYFNRDYRTGKRHKHGWFRRKRTWFL